MIRRVAPLPRLAVRRGFTLIELGVVVAIIGVLISLVLVASAEGVQRARVRATQATITKLDAGVTERLDSILNMRVEPNGAHQYMAAVYPGTTAGPWGLPSEARAQVIAQHDLVKSELPDVFVINAGDPWYPLNFAGLAYPDPTVGATSANRDAFLLPLGHFVGGTLTFGNEGYQVGSIHPTTSAPINLGPGANWIIPATINNPPVQTVNTRLNSTGIYGASYTARASFNQLLGVSPRGYDMVDNDGNQFIDELTPAETGMSAGEITAILTRLSNHQHTTARSEVLYALLIGGQGPMGAIFTTEDFGPTEIGDTDDDGLPEFLDAWGKPLQFYRWPIHFSSPTGPSLQKGSVPYANGTEPRQTSALDPNQLLVAPAWFMGDVNVRVGAPMGDRVGPISGRGNAFGLFFHSIIDPNSSGGAAIGQLWDRTAASISTTTLAARRAFYSRPLIASGGPDGQLGIAQVDFDYSNYSMPNGGQTPTRLMPDGTPAVAPPVPPGLVVQVAECPAPRVAPHREFRNAPYFPVNSSVPGADPLTYALGDATEGWSLDDITNQTIQTTAGGTGQ
jgi:prepilin-type N-terminal cleavage/methylation domain-containing protein